MFCAWLIIIYRKHTHTQILYMTVVNTSKLQTLMHRETLSCDVRFQTSDIVTNITLAKINHSE